VKSGGEMIMNCKQERTEREAVLAISWEHLRKFLVRVADCCAVTQQEYYHVTGQQIGDNIT
jgi:hypothetical protein